MILQEIKVNTDLIGLIHELKSLGPWLIGGIVVLVAFYIACRYKLPWVRGKE